MTIAIPVLDRCTKLNLFRAARCIQMTPTASRVLQFLIDDATAYRWSLQMLAKAVGRRPRTVDVAIAELKKLGFIEVLYRRRGTAFKVLRVDAILHATSRAVSIARAAARAAILLFRRKLQASHKTREQISIVDIKRAEDASWRVQRPASAAQLRLMGLPVPPGRR